jgi:[ribosomal protein S5]-alanine N-acetyltransferase
MRLATERLVLRSTTPDDAQNLFNLFRDPRVMRFLPPAQQPITLELIAKAIERRRELETRLGFAPLTVETKDTRSFVGNAGLQPVKDTSEVEIAYHLAPAYWGKGYASELATELLRCGLHEIKLDKIIGICFAENYASARVLEKAGMHYEGLCSYFGLEGLKKYSCNLQNWSPKRV